MSTFICYRRSDSENITGRIFDRLEDELGSNHVFKDVDSIPLGADFTIFITETLKRCKILVAVIGKGWIDAVDDVGNRRLNNPEDWVRIEIETALKAKILVVPLLVNGAKMPRTKELPKELRKLASLNAACARPDPDFHKDMNRLLKVIDPTRSQKARISAAQPRQPAARKENSSSSSRKSNRSKASQPIKVRVRTPTKRTVKLNKRGVSELPGDKPVVYKILTKAKRINYVGSAKRWDVQAAISEHLLGGKHYVPGDTVQIIRMDRINAAQKKAAELIVKKTPRYNL